MNKWVKEDEHARNPQVGDYWHEMYVPVCKVVGVTPEHVLLWTEVIVEGDGWRWREEVKRMTREEFRRWLSYESMPGYWARVIPGNGEGSSNKGQEDWVRDLAENFQWHLDRCVLVVSVASGLRIVRVKLKAYFPEPYYGEVVYYLAEGNVYVKDSEDGAEIRVKKGTELYRKFMSIYDSVFRDFVERIMWVKGGERREDG